MERDYLIVIDMQEDFIYGALGNEETRKIVPEVVKRVREFQGTVIFTRDTHQKNYLDTQEGKLLPVEHCIEGTKGWELIEELEEYQKINKSEVFDKPTFGCLELGQKLAGIHQRENIHSITCIGVCTDICVVSNALLLKASMPEVPIYVDAFCCAGVTPAKHEQALETMRSCQILVREREEEN